MSPDLMIVHTIWQLIITGIETGNEMKRNGIVSLSEGPNIWAKLINYCYGLLTVTDDDDY